MGNSVTSQVLFHPPNPPTPLIPHQKYFWIETSTKLLIPAIFIAHESNPNARFTLLYSHGHDVDLGLIYDFLVDLSRLLRVNIMSYDYGGYGMGMVKKTSVVLPNGGSGRKANRGKRVGSNPYDNEEDQYDTDSNSDSSDDYEDRTSPQVEIIQPSEKQCYADIEACHNYLVYNKGISPAHILLYGKSLGSGPTLWLAQRLYRRYFKCREAALSRQMSGQYKAIMAQMKKNGSDGSVTSGASKKGLKVQYYSSSSNISLDGQSHMELRTSPSEKDGGNGNNNDADKMPVLPLAGVVLHGAFLSVMRIMLNMGFTASGDCFPNADRIGDVKCPIYIIHAKEDEVIPFSHGKSLYETIVMANGGKVFPPFWADDAAHNNIEQKYATAYVKRLQQFIKHCDVRVTKECGDNSGERVKYVRDRSLSVEKSKSFGGRVGSNVSGKSSSSKSKSKSKSKNSKIGNDTTNVVTKDNSSSPPTRGRSKSTPRNENRLNDNLQNHRTSSRSRRMNPIEKRSISANRGTQVENQSPPAVASSNARPRTPSRAQTRGQLSLTSSRNRGRATVRDKSTPAHGTLAQPSTLNKKVLPKSLPSAVSSAVISKSASSDARGRVAGAANTSRGRGRSRDSRNCMQDPLEIQRARSNSRARERKKRGTLVMRGNHEDEEFIKNDGGDGAAARKDSGKGTNTKCVRKETEGDIGTDSSISTTSLGTATVATVNSTITDDWYDGFVYLKSPDTKALSSGISRKQDRIDASTLAVDQNGGTERESRNPAN